MRLRPRRPPGIPANFTVGMRGDRRGAVVGGGLSGLGRRGALRVMAGTLPGVLLRINRTCVRGVGIGCDHYWWGICNATQYWHPLFRWCDCHPFFRQGGGNGTGSKLRVVCWQEQFVERVSDLGFRPGCVLLGNKLRFERGEYLLLLNRRQFFEGVDHLIFSNLVSVLSS